MERRTHEEFEMLHQFLKAEEEARMASLKEEQESKTERMRQKIEEVNHNIAALSDTIRSLEAEMALEDISLLHVSSSADGRHLNDLF